MNLLDWLYKPFQWNFYHVCVQFAYINWLSKKNNNNIAYINWRHIVLSWVGTWQLQKIRKNFIIIFHFYTLLSLCLCLKIISRRQLRNNFYKRLPRLLPHKRHFFCGSILLLFIQTLTQPLLSHFTSILDDEISESPSPVNLYFYGSASLFIVNIASNIFFPVMLSFSPLQE